MCIPKNYTGFGDNECLNNCPISCGLNEIYCPAATNPSTGILCFINCFYGYFVEQENTIKRYIKEMLGFDKKIKFNQNFLLLSVKI